MGTLLPPFAKTHGRLTAGLLSTDFIAREVILPLQLQIFRKFSSYIVKFYQI